MQSSQLFQTKRKQFSGFRSGDEPGSWWEQPSLAISAKVKGGLALDALGNVDGELDTVVAEGVGGCGSVDRSATVTTQNTAGLSVYISWDGILRLTYVALVLLTAWLPEKAPAIDTGASRSMDAIIKSVDEYLGGCGVVDCPQD